MKNYNEDSKEHIHSVVGHGVLMGQSYKEIAFNLGISERTLLRWKNKYKELEEVIDYAKKRRKFACMPVDINEEAYDLAERMIDTLSEEVGAENVDRDFQIGCQYTYLINLLRNK